MPTAEITGRKRLRRQALREFTIPVLACIGLLTVSVILAIWRVGVQESELREKFLTETLALASSLSLQPRAAFDLAADNQTCPESARLSCHLHRFAAFAGYRDIWTMGQRNGEFRFGPSGSSVDGEDSDPDPTHRVAEPPPGVAQVFATGQAAITAAYPRHGTPVISALAVIPLARENAGAQWIVGVDLTEHHWRVALWNAALLPLGLGGLLTLVFIAAVVIVYRGRADREETQTQLRYLEPALAALTGTVLSVAATAIVYQLEQHFESDLLEWVSAQASSDLTLTLRQFAQDEASWSLTDADVSPGINAIDNLFHQTLNQQSYSKKLIHAHLLTLNDQGGAHLIRTIPKTALDTAPNAAIFKTAAFDPLSFTAQLQELIPIFLGDTTLAMQLRISSNAAGHPPLRTDVITALIGLILTLVAAALVIWLRGRLTDVERLLNQRTMALQQREANFTAITSSMRDAIVMMDTDAKIIYWNPAAEQLFGYTEGEAMGTDLHHLLAGPEIAAAFHARDESGANTLGNSPSIGQLIEVEAQHKDGSQVPLELSLSAMRMDGEWHAIGVLRDISARKRSRERLVKLNDCLAHLGSDYRENIHQITTVCGEILNADAALYNRLDDNLLTSLGIWHAPPDFPVRDTPEGHICYDLILGQDERTNGRCGSEFSANEISREAFFLGDLSQTAYPEIDPAVRKYDLKAYFGHVVRCGSETVGSLCVVFKRQRSPSDEEKRLLGILAAALTTEENRHLTTRELELSEKRMSLAMRSTGIGIWEYEPETRQLRLDDAMHGLLSLQPLQATRSIDDWILRLLPEDMPKIQCTLKQVIATDGELDQELRLQRTEDELGYLRVIGSVHCNPNSDNRHVIGVCYDITRRKESEARLRQARDIAEQASRTKTQFLSQVSHELRTPMNAVLGFAQLLDSDPDLNSDQRDSIQEILTSGRHLLKLIDEVLDLAQIESGETGLQVQQIVLAPALEESLTLIRQLANEHELSIDFSSPKNLAVAADPFRLKQVLVNLLSNAVKFNRPGGSIKLEATAMPAKQTSDEWVRISVRDTGTGIPADQLGELFEPFRRLPEAQLSGIEGSGIGLAVVKRLVDLMDGQIGVDSVPGEGSCFWFELPRQPAATATAPLLRPESTTPLLL